MELSVYIRPLKIEDADISYKWRNNKKIWRLTGNRPDCEVTPEMEREWLKSVLSRPNEKRFAICLKEKDIYIGNIFFTDIHDGQALIHIFIGDIENWGRRRAFEALVQLVQYGFEELKLEVIYALIDKRNVLSSGLAKLTHSKRVEEYVDQKSQLEMIKWAFTKKMFEENVHLISLQKIS